MELQSSDMDDASFCRWLVAEHKVAAVPLSPFYERDPGTRLIRLCFAKREETLREAAERLAKV
jgi:methionine aminotransferase